MYGVTQTETSYRDCASSKLQVKSIYKHRAGAYKGECESEYKGRTG
jgi:hypothetical protein